MSVGCIDNSVIPFDTLENCQSCFNTDYCTMVESGDVTDLQFTLDPVTGINLLQPPSYVGFDNGAFSPQIAGTTDGSAANKLIDSSESFGAAGVLVGAIVKNTTDNTYASVTAVDSDTQLSLSANIFTSGEGYIILNWSLNTGTLGTGLVFDGTSVSFQTAAASIRKTDLLENGKYYRAKITSTTNGIGVGRLLLTNGIGVTYFQFGIANNHTETVVFFQASGTTLQLGSTTPMGTTTFNVENIEITEMSSIEYILRDCENEAVEYYSGTSGVTYNTDIQYLNNPDAQFYANLVLDWSTYGDLPSPGCFCLCVKDLAYSEYNFINNGDFEKVTLPEFAENWQVNNDASTNGWSLSDSTQASHVADVAGGTDTLSQELLTPLDEDLCYVLSFDYASDNGFTLVVKYDTATLSGQTLATVTKGSGSGTHSIDVTNLGITAVYFETDTDEAFTISDIELLLDAECYECSCLSSCISIAESHDSSNLFGCNMLFTATNNSNALGFNFEDFEFTQRLRLFAKIRNATHQDESEYYIDSSGLKSLTYLNTEKVIELQVYEVPEGVHDALHAMMRLNNFQIDGVRYNMVGEYSPNWRKSSAKAPVIVQIAKAQQDRFNTFG